MVLAAMLKIGLSSETMPCLPWADDDTKGACGESFIGVIMFITNTVVPLSTLAMGLVIEGMAYDLKFPDDQMGGQEGGFDNPIADSADTFEVDAEGGGSKPAAQEGKKN